MNDSSSPLDAFAIVLVCVQNSGNVGSVARAMHNMGMTRLALVDPQCDPRADEARWMARDGWVLIEQAEIVPSLDDALKDSHFAVATTARQGKRRVASSTPRDLAPSLIERAAASEKIALLFGPEDRGLSAEHVSRCQEILTIPTSDEFLSLNLAQAVLIVAYELFTSVAIRPVSPTPRGCKRAALELQESMLQDLQSVLLEIGYLDRHNPEHIMLDLRRLLGRADLTEREVRILRGVARQIRWAAGIEPKPGA